MMKRIVLFLLVCLMPVLSFADDTAEDDFDDFLTGVMINAVIADDKGDSGMFHDRCEQNGAYSGKYTIDRRCYITNEQKKQFPYNAVVDIYGKSHGCTGTLVKDSFDKLYVYTAAHCVHDPDALLTVKLQDGTKFSAIPDMIEPESGDHPDIVVLTILEKNTTSLPFVKMGQFNSGDRFNVIGYGSLAILSDKTIHDVKRMYANYMDIDENKLESDKKIYAKFDKFLQDHTTVFADGGNLKGSFDCSLRNGYLVQKGRKQTDCQAVSGNSGGPVFDKNNNLVAVLSTVLKFQMQDKRYALTDVKGVEPVSDIKSRISNYKLVVYLNDIGCFIETKDGRGHIVADKLCDEKKPPRSFDNSWWVGVKNGKHTWGVSHCYNKNEYPGATSIDFDSISDIEHGRYCWCRFINQTSKNQEKMAYFSGKGFENEQKCKDSCNHTCAKWFFGE